MDMYMYNLNAFQRRLCIKKENQTKTWINMTHLIEQKSRIEEKLKHTKEISKFY